MSQIDPDIQWYYERGGEIDRIEKVHRLEGVRTQRIITRRIPQGSLTIADVGGGAGVYSFWLAEAGHTVHLVEPVELHLEQARRISGETGIALAGMHHANAEELPFDDATFDVVLLMGPLYHLPNRDRRIAALAEARRVLRPNGLLFAATISRYASAVDGFFKNYVADETFAETMRSTIVHGHHRNPNRAEGMFTTSYFHRPEELREELEEAEFSNVEVLMIEGLWGYLPDFERRWEDERFRSLLLETMEVIESDPSVVGTCGHVMGVGRKES